MEKMSGEIIRIERYRIDTDGQGISTLVAFHGCPLKCRYCLNDFCHDAACPRTYISPELLIEKVRVDAPYYEMSGGGIVFGGGEPLLNSTYILHFAQMMPKEWVLRIETSLHVPWEAIQPLVPYVTEWLVDVKDTNPEIYQKYTGMDNGVVLDNCRKLSAAVGSDRILFRLPLIPGYNTEADRDKSRRLLDSLGRQDIFTYQLT